MIPNGRDLPDTCVVTPARDFTSNLIKINEFINPLQNTHVLTGTLRFRTGSRLALRQIPAIWDQVYNFL